MVKTRCSWAIDEAMIKYHDTEWGRPEHDDTKLHEFLILEGAQAGLSWSTILNRRDGYRRAFSGFDPVAVASYGPEKVRDLLQDEGIIRNRRKIESAINNATKFLAIQEEYGDFDRYIWGLSGGPVKNTFKSHSELPPFTPASQHMSAQLKEHGFTFVGPTICYAYMQATGMVNDHTKGCFLHNK